MKKSGNIPLIVGIGASAGGLEALERFLEGVPEDSGMAFVIVQHLDPDYKGAMPELLQRKTKMKVVEVTDRIKVRPDRVYIIPPNRDMSLLHGVLHLLEPAEPRGHRFPIDSFFSSLADDLGEKSIGVILSGMGTDGTAGLRAIREKGGLCLVQDLSSAKFNGMPKSAIDNGLADIVAPAEELPAGILGFIRHIPGTGEKKPAIGQKSGSSLEEIVILLRARTGHDFSMYKKNMVYRRIERRMAIHQIDRIATYVHFLHENRREIDILFRELLIGVTSFFRDPAVWDRLRDVVIPGIIDKTPDGTKLRAWVAGCSTGEEVYSLAIVFREALQQVRPEGRISLQIYATDLDGDAIEKARVGVYQENILVDVSEERLNRFFLREEDGKIRIGKEIREMVIFAQQNLIMDPPFTRLDLLSCRNLLIYLEPAIQKKILPLFHYALNPGGILILGTAETVNGYTNLFSEIEPKLRIFSHTKQALPAEPVEFPVRLYGRRTEIKAELFPTIPVANLQSLTDRLLLQQYTPAAVMTTEAGDILYIHGRTGKYLEPTAGKVNWNIFAMAREGLRHELTTIFRQTLQTKETITAKGIRVQTETGTQDVDVTVQLINDPPELKGKMLVILTDVAPLQPRRKKKTQSGIKTTEYARIGEMENLLRQSEEEMNALREEMQISQEELKSTNEELQSTNEELQSTNEELTTSKEEMQSLNEELQTVNAELESRVDDLSRSNNDMKNLLNSTDIAMVFLDESLNVRRFTTEATKVIRLIPGDVGRPFTDLVSELIYPNLPDDARKVQRTLMFSEKTVPTKDNRWFSVRIMPYRTLDNRIDGVVITFINITAHKELEDELMSARIFAESVTEALRESLLVLDMNMKVISANRSFLRTFHVAKDGVEGRNIYTLGNGQWNIPKLKELLDSVLSKNMAFEDFLVEHDFPDIGHRAMLLNARQIVTNRPDNGLILLAIEDITGK
ncbi:MAG: PAS domain-containing protein [Methanomicrobiaceae archaeon]|nr:PAS domain-containing protein [Methanomicrobiaceae archaeon]